MSGDFACYVCAAATLHLIRRAVCALGNDRCYRKALPMVEVLVYFQSERGKQFDPALVDLLMKNIDKIEKVQADFQDPA